MFRSPKDHPQGVRQALLKLPLCTINVYAFVGDVGAFTHIKMLKIPNKTPTCFGPRRTILREYVKPC